MKKLLGLLFFIVALCVAPSLTEAKVIWDGAEIVKGQVGKLIFNKDVKIYKKNADNTFTSLVVKKGQSYRVYSVNKESVGIVYGMSGGYRVQQTNLVSYKAIPAATIQALGVPYTIKNVELDTWMKHDVRIAQVSGLLNKANEDRINLLLRQGINYAMEDINGIEEYLYEFMEEGRDFTEMYATKWIDRVVGNESNLFSVESTYYSGTTVVLDTAFAYNTYNLLTGKKVELEEFVNTPAKKKKLRELIIKEATSQGISLDQLEMYYYYPGVYDFNKLPYHFYIQDNQFYFMFYSYAEQRDYETRIYIPVSMQAIQNVK